MQENEIKQNRSTSNAQVEKRLLKHLQPLLSNFLPFPVTASTKFKKHDKQFDCFI